MLYFVWYDDTPKKPAVDKVQEAIAAYVERFKTRPSLILVNATEQAQFVEGAVDLMQMSAVIVRCERTVQPNTFWVGHEDGADTPAA